MYQNGLNRRINFSEMASRMKGFSLIELMVVLAIVAILATVGGASYQSYVQRGMRADAQRVMMEIAAKQEQFLMYNQVYSAVLDNTGLNYDVNNNVIDNYNINLATTVNPDTFTITATGINTMAGEVLTLNNDGVKTPGDLWE